jgi:hypothetical protein
MPKKSSGIVTEIEGGEGVEVQERNEITQKYTKYLSGK